MRTNVVLIDFENVRPDSLTALVGAHFKLMVFVGANQVKLTVEFAMAVPPHVRIVVASIETQWEAQMKDYHGTIRTSI